MGKIQFDYRTAFHEYWANQRPRSYYDDIIRFTPTRAARALDIGCGSGQLVLHLAGQVQFAMGLDRAHSMIDLARRKQTFERIQNVAWVVGNADALPFAGESFDFISSALALRFSHLAQSRAEVQRVSKPGGRVAIKEWITAPARLFWVRYLKVQILLLPFIYGRYGARGVFKTLLHSTKPATVEFVRQSQSLEPTRFDEQYAKSFAGCRILSERDARTLLWSKPTRHDSTPDSR